MRRIAVISAIVAAGVSLALTTGVAHAETIVIHDRPGESGPADITRVAVTNGKRVDVTVTFDGSLAAHTDVYLDTRRGAGPEYVVRHVGRRAVRHDFEVYRIDGFRDRPGPGDRACRGDDAEIDREGDDSVTLPVRRRCIYYPGRVRVAVEAYDGTSGRSSDWVPGREQLSPGVARG